MSGPHSPGDRAGGRVPARFGFPVNVLGRPGLKGADHRRWQSGPHLRVSLGYLRPIFDYLASQRINMYRMASNLAPYVTHPDLPQFHRQVEECQEELATFGALAREQGLRLSFHPSQYIILNSPDDRLTTHSVRDVAAQVAILDAMGLGPEAVLVIHVGGAYGDVAAGRERWMRTYEGLSSAVRRRLVLENDDVSYGAADVLHIHERTGVPLVFDHQHFCCFNPERRPLSETVRRFLETWPDGVRPKVHFSSPRTQLRQVQRRNRKTKKLETVLLPPLWTGHADYCDPFGFIDFMRRTPADVTFDVMLEAKAKDLALRRLRADLAGYAPDVAARFGLNAAEVPPEDEGVIVGGTGTGAAEAEA